MSLASIIHWVLGIDVEPDRERTIEAHRTWRDAIHSNRNEASRAIATALTAHKVSDAALKSLQTTIKAQEEAGARSTEQNYLARLRELD